MTRRHHGVLALLFALGCSTLASPPPEVECTVDTDCEGASMACEFGVCRDASGQPPLEYIGLDLQEVVGGQGQFRVELEGCDTEVDELGGASIRVLSLPRAEVALRLLLGVESAPGGGTFEPMPATFTLSQASRFARDEVRRQVRFEPVEDSDEVQTAEVVWPRYHVDNELPTFLQSDSVLVWATQPQALEDAPTPALRYQLLSPPTITPDPVVTCSTDADCCMDDSCDPEDVRNACVTSLGECRTPFNDSVIYNAEYNEDCDREIRGRVALVTEALTEAGPVPGASITIRHADPVDGDSLGLPQLDTTPVEERAPQCPQGTCPQGLRCNDETEQCELPLAGRTAWAGASASSDDAANEGDVEARVYTYCEGLDRSFALDRSFEVTVIPPEELGAPRVTLRADVSIPPFQASQKPVANFPGTLCVPTLGQPKSVAVSPSAEPRDLLGDGEYVCCDTDCLPRTADEAAAGPPERATACTGATSGAAVSFRAERALRFDDEQLQAWAETDCVPLAPDSEGVVGLLRRSGTCSSDMSDDSSTTCNFEVPPTVAEPDPQQCYDVRLETPVGSVAGSTRISEFCVDDVDTPMLSPQTLPQRVLVRGRVVIPRPACEPADETDGDCGSPGAQILAERLQTADDTVATTPGPYFHQASTFYDPTAIAGRRDGSYILPLDRGVWILTALPDAGTDGGPASFTIVDLRNLDEDTFNLPFELDPGILVTVDVSSFERSTQIIPLDSGSWLLGGNTSLSHPDSPGVPLDLGAPGVCLSADENFGCRIRRLTGGSALPPSQIGQVRFTTRDVPNSVDCR